MHGLCGGSLQFRHLRKTCQACQAGKASSTTGATSSSECKACEPRKYSREASPSCTNCVAGRYSSTSSATSNSTCIACEAGKVNSAIGAFSESMCTPCTSEVSSDDRTFCFCGLGSGTNHVPPISQLEDGIKVRIRP